MKIKVEQGHAGTYEIISKDGRDILIQTDYDFVPLAETFGFTGGTIAEAAEYLDNHCGEWVKDPGYFEDLPETAEDAETDSEIVDIDEEELATEIYNLSLGLRKTYKPEDCQEPGTDFCGVDIRLRLVNGMWDLLVGDAQYDTDHRGIVAASSVPLECTPEEALAIAEELISQID